MNVENKVPDIRFKGCSGGWEEKALDCEVDFYSGLTYSPNDVVKEVGTFVLRSSNVKEGQIVDADNVYVNSAVVNSEYVKHGDIIVVVRNGSRSLIGKHAQITQRMNNTVIGAFMTGIRSEHSDFINALLDTNQFNKEIEKNLGATINQITTGAFKKMCFWFSTAEEKTKIGNYFQQIDTLIAQHQQKHDKLLNLKKALLEKMFPKQGKKEPEIRFKGFSGEWNEVTLGEIAKITMGQSPNSENYTNNPEDHILVQGNADMKNGFVKPRVWTSQVTKTADAGDLIFSVRAPVGEVGKTIYNLVIGRGIAAIKANEFIFQSLRKKNSDGYWKKLSAGSTFDSINSKDLSTSVIQQPSDYEQTKIGVFFEQIDALLKQHQAQFEKLNNIKQACLEKMFV